MSISENGIQSRGRFLALEISTYRSFQLKWRRRNISNIFKFGTLFLILIFGLSGFYFCFLSFGAYGAFITAPLSAPKTRPWELRYWQWGVPSVPPRRHFAPPAPLAISMVSWTSKICCLRRMPPLLRRRRFLHLIRHFYFIPKRPFASSEGFLLWLHCGAMAQGFLPLSGSLRAQYWQQL